MRVRHLAQAFEHEPWHVLSSSAPSVNHQLFKYLKCSSSSPLYCSLHSKTLWPTSGTNQCYHLQYLQRRVCRNRFVSPKNLAESKFDFLLCCLSLKTFLIISFHLFHLHTPRVNFSASLGNLLELKKLERIFDYHCAIRRHLTAAADNCFYWHYLIPIELLLSFYSRVIKLIAAFVTVEK